MSDQNKFTNKLQRKYLQVLHSPKFLNDEEELSDSSGNLPITLNNYAVENFVDFIERMNNGTDKKLNLVYVSRFYTESTHR